MPRVNNSKHGYWFKFFYTECMVCGRSSNWKEKQRTTRKPKNPALRHDYNQEYCGCLDR